MEMQKKQFTFKGKTLEELKTLDVREFARLLKSRQRRTVLRNFQEIEEFINRSKKKIGNNKPIKTHKRDLVIVPEMIGMKIQIYNGRNFVSVEIIKEMLGHKFGEFALTRGRVKHGSVGVGATKGSKAKAKK
ncbi:30S ribosomal protein S19 [Candidatus Pacearchaeota archaeon]|jgi:small subunit ribosomal protein S19|nr:30S ribosomal protein S19 [Candidatus Pacearchaeota archaeon]|tara:strand:+ start:169 stop:564 length:396 start_codon:yes stop_codon:yes gene_type:complete